MSTPPGPQDPNAYGATPPPPGGGYGATPPGGGYGGDAAPPPNYYGGGSGTPPTPPPPNHLVWAIISVFLCWPLAIPAIINATQVNSKWALGDVAGAQSASANARKFALWATIAGAIAIVIAIIANIAGFAAMSTTGYTS
ncbi:MAG: Interferon-induced transrane protein [Actinotalea sp.]|nr:Interferon-induced transrane protein [Actinotalea sp.]